MARSRRAHKQGMATFAGGVGLTLVLAACGSNGGNGGEAVPLDEEQTLSVWGWSNAPGADTMEDIIGAFEEEHDHISVSYTEITNTDYANRATLGLDSEQDVDVIAVFPNPWAAENEHYLTPVSEWPGVDGLEDNFSDLALDQTSRLFTDGELRAVPFGSTGSAVGIYNAELIRDAGLDGPPRTWDEMEELADGLAETHPDAIVAAMPSDEWFQPEMVETMVGQTTPDWFNNFRYEGADYVTPEYEAALTRYAELFESGVLDVATMDLDYASASNLFDTGRAAILFNGTWEAGRLLEDYREANALVPTEVGIMPVPSDDPSHDGSMRSFLDITYGIPQHTDKKEAAAAFIEFVTAGAGVDVWGPRVNFIPALEEWTMPDDALGTELEAEGYELLVELVTNPHSDRNNLPNFADRVGSNVVATVTGSTTVEDALEAIRQDQESGMYDS